MSELLAMSFDCVSSPTLKLKMDQNRSTVSGWGYGWYPNDDSGAAVVKDSGSSDMGGLRAALSDWRRFRSTNFLFKIKGATKRYSQQDTQPFRRSFAGRDWLFLHNGDLDREQLRQLLDPTAGFLDPVGNTDSELAFCYILQEIQRSGCRRIAELPKGQILEWLQRLDGTGSADIIFSDGKMQVAYHGANSKGELHYWRRKPKASESDIIDGESYTVDLGDPNDVYRTGFLISSQPHFGKSSQRMNPGQMLVISHGDMVWNSQTDNSLEKRFGPNFLRPLEQQVSILQPFSSNQMVQPQGSQIGAPMQPTPTNIKSIIRTSDGNPLEFRSYKVSHTTAYAYSSPVERSTHLLRLQPVEDRSQEVVSSTLSFSANGNRLAFEDVFGNQAMHITVDEPYTNLEIKVESEIKVYAMPPEDFNSDMRRTSIPMVWMPWQRQMMLPYLLPPELPEPQLLELTNYAMSFVEKGDYNLVDTLSEMNKQIFKDFNYVQGSTNNETTPFEVYSSRNGVCQDFANLFICLARLLNIPSRYRVGYIHTGADYANKLQSEASHAWLEVYLPYLGWRGYDPTNGCEVNQDHIRVACGRNYRDATPTGGTIYKGGGNESLNVSVKVENLAP